MQRQARASSILAALTRRVRPFASSTDVVRPNETLRGFVWHASGVHQFYVGAIAVSVALVNFVPIDLQRRIVDEAIASKDTAALLVLGGLYLLAVLLHAGLKYALMVYQSWVGESTVKAARDQIARAASERSASDQARSGQTANIIGNEIDAVGGFVGTSISEFVVNATLMLVVASYMLYVQPVIALAAAISLIPQMWLALYMQADLNMLVERQVGLVRKLGNQTVDSAAGRSKQRRTASRTIRTIFSNRIELYLLKFGLKALLNITNAFGSLVVLVVGGYLVIRGQTTIGTVVAFISGFQRLSEPTGDLLDFYRVYSQAKVQFQMIVRWVAGEHPGKLAKAR
jgi:ABC-type bacteriocin/lantibiotic exporter with double-glycine peptidase domain